MDKKHAVLITFVIVFGIAGAILLTKFQPETLKEKIYGGTPFTTVITPPVPICTQDTWSCGDWSACSQEGNQTRSCTKTNDCPFADTPSPPTSQSCEPPPPPCSADTWSCGGWSYCSASGTQTRSCSKTNDCPFADTPSPSQSRSCTPPTPPPPPKTAPETAPEPAPQVSPAAPEPEQLSESKQEEIQQTPEGQAPTQQEVTVTFEEFAPVIKQTFPEEKPETLILSPICDSDHDGICDSEEQKNGTDPYQYDTDHDGIADSADPDPVTPATCPDENKNGVCDDQEKRIEQISRVSLTESGMRDTDKDGISDLIEARIGTDINNGDTDLDGVTDGVEYLELASNPKKSEAKPKIETPIITNIRSGEVVASNFTLSGVAPANQYLDVWLLYKDGRKVSLGSVQSLENGRFLFNNTKKFASGQFIVYVEASDALPPCGFGSAQANILCEENLQAAVIAQGNTANSSKKRSQLILIEIAKEEPVKAPEPSRLADAEISKEIILKNLQVTIKENTPILSGTTELGTTVVANWTSALLSSAIIADVAGGGFEIKAPSPLLAGDHRVLVYAKQAEFGTVSPSVAVSFKITQEGEVTDQKEEILPPESAVKKAFPWVYVAIGAVIAIAGIAIALTLRKKP